MNNKEKLEIAKKIEEAVKKECDLKKEIALKHVRMSNRLLSLNLFPEISISNKEYSDLCLFLPYSTRKIIKEIIINDIEKQVNEYLLKEGFLK